MESINIPTSRKLKTNETQGQLDDLGFFRTPDGSFWDIDEEYFNRHGYDIHGGSYSKDFEYIPGASWLSELGCYPDEKEKYLNPKFDDEEEEEEEIPENEDDFKGDFEDDYDEDLSPEDLKNIEIQDKELLNKLIAEYNIKDNSNSVNNKTSKKNSKAKKLKNKKKNQNDIDEEGWETFEEDEEEIDKMCEKVSKINKDK